MRVAANQVEKVLEQAEAEHQHAEAGLKHSAGFQDLVAAFKRAAELRDAPLRSYTLRGTKDRKPYVAIATHDRKHVGSETYILCLVPARADSSRTHKYFIELKSDEGKVISRRLIDSGLVPRYDHVWIRESRLK